MFFTTDHPFEDLFVNSIQLFNKTWKEMRATSADFLKVLDADKSIAVEIENAESATLLSTDDGYGYVVMPLAGDR